MSEKEVNPVQKKIFDADTAVLELSKPEEEKETNGVVIDGPLNIIISKLLIESDKSKNEFAIESQANDAITNTAFLASQIKKNTRINITVPRNQAKIGDVSYVPEINDSYVLAVEPNDVKDTTVGTEEKLALALDNFEDVSLLVDSSYGDVVNENFNKILMQCKSNSVNVFIRKTDLLKHLVKRSNKNAIQTNT